ncbi:uncharacterized protein [Epargyreus clarus]|uniref:uncharacterized protein n=1 Tax=Epargyreus clarus TaxID=520877 RepID=UPI003C306D13
METRKKNTVFGKCRCCNVEGHHRDLLKEYTTNGAREIYYNMFMECFNLFLSTTPGLSQVICWSCIVRLRDAVAFRTLVATTEQTLLNSLANKDTVFINVPIQHDLEAELVVKREVMREVKQEPLLNEVDQETQEAQDNGLDGDYTDDSEDLLDENDESNVDVSEALVDTGALVEGEAEFVAKFQPSNFRLPTRTTLYANSLSGFVNHLDMLKGKLIFPKTLERLIDESEHEIIYDHKKVYLTEKMAHIMNASTLLQNSNATPFKSKNRFGFPCYYCRSVYENLEKLKGHQVKMHRKAELKKILSGYGAECLVVYADVTDLKCTICDENIPKLSDLKSHLIKIHDKKMYTEYPDRVIPFKLSPTNVYECQVCGFSFETFGSIERHMNVHFRNYVCKECGTGFVTKYRLKVHTKSMHIEGNFPCEDCKKVFTTQQKHKNHVDTVHKMVKRFKCPKCPERFSEYFRRQKHLVEVHGVAPLQYKCNVCDKTFDRRYTLSRHMKRDHLEERDFQCQLCTYKCFTNNELRVHMIKHNGERVHECSVCKKSYARKKTLREHMRIHNNDRRFACAVCGQAFVQKCSLKGHIKTHHLEYSLQ